MKRVGRELAAEISPMERIASKLPNVRREERPSVVVDYHPRIVNYAVACIDYVLAEQRILTRPEVCPVAAYPIQQIFSHEQVAAGIVVNIAPHATRLVTIAIVAGNKKIVVYSPSEF